MSVSTEVQRTLVKSPPELWSELSNPEALARHLAELGEIRITSTEPETKVEWEAEGATGVVHLKQSGWGTKVTLSVTRVPPISDESPEFPAEAKPLPEPTAAVESAAEPAVEPESVAEGEPEPTVEAERTPEPVAEDQPEPEPVAVAESVVEAMTEPEPVAEAEAEPTPESEQVSESEQISAPEPRPGFFARLFRWRAPKHSEPVEPEPKPTAVEPEPEAVEPQPDFEPLAAPELIYEPTPRPAVDLAAELASVEAQMEQETTELLMGVLDRLGAAHHRPFSRG